MPGREVESFWQALLFATNRPRPRTSIDVRMIDGRKRSGIRQGGALAMVLAAALASACTDRGITGPAPSSGGSHPGFDTSIYPGDDPMNAWRRPSSPYEWADYYLQ